LKELGSQQLLPQDHYNFLSEISKVVKPKVIYDIGACVLHWTNVAEKMWPESEFIAFEAMDECASIYEDRSLKYHCGPLGDEDGKEIEFFENLEHPGGNSYYRENIEINPEAHDYFPDSSAIKKKLSRLDTVVKQKNLPKPDLIKMDVQGAELDVLKGCGELLDTCDHIILELPNVEYNVGAPSKEDVINWLAEKGFVWQGRFCGKDSDYDGDHYFRRVKEVKGVKKILIGIPTARYVETETMKSIYDMIVPEGYETELQFFYGYQIDQIRNLIASWVVNGPYDYLLSIDSDIIFPKDMLIKMLNHDKDLVSGVYRQRLPDQVIELYDLKQRNIPLGALPVNELIEIGGCGFGCVLVKKEVFVNIGYPQFEYHSALDHRDTFSEDNDFCKKALNLGHKLFADTSIMCGHKGTHIYEIQRTV
jgi:FkbM family methyltransferase